MRRTTAEVRPDWQRKLTDVGAVIDPRYSRFEWAEDCFYVIDGDIARLLGEAATHAYALCLELVQEIIAGDKFSSFDVPGKLIPAILRSWEERIPALITRLDFDPGTGSVPRLAGLAAEDPAPLRLVGPVQWDWKVESFPEGSQYNELYESLLYFFKNSRLANLHWVFSGERGEERAAARYLYRIAREGGLACEYTRLSKIEWDDENECFVSPSGNEVGAFCKVYPWRWIVEDPFGPAAVKKGLYFFEPAWKAVLSAPRFLAEWNSRYLDVVAKEVPGLKCTGACHLYQLQVWMVNDSDAAMTVCEYRNGLAGKGTIVPHVLMDEEELEKSID